MTPEGRVKAKLKRKLDKVPHLYRFMPVQNGMGAPALDYYGCCRSWFIAIETKKPGGKLTARQEMTKKQIEDAGGLVFVVDTDEAIERCFHALLAIAAFDPQRRHLKSGGDEHGRT